MAGSGGVTFVLILTIITIVSAQQFDSFQGWNFFQQQNGRFDPFTRQSNIRQENFFDRATERARHSFSTTTKPTFKYTTPSRFDFNQRHVETNTGKADFNNQFNRENVSPVNSERDNHRQNDFNKPKNTAVPGPVNLLTDSSSRFTADFSNNDYRKKNGEVAGDTRNVNVANLDFNTGSFRRTTQSPLLTRPGVVPATVETGRPPLTNRPTRENGISPTVSSDRFSEDESPPLLMAPNEADMTSEQKKRHIEKVENLCRKFKSSLTGNIALLPLTPNAKPIVKNVSTCHVASTPLIINGKIVDIKDFPHMALVGWKKIQEPGYSWKCGGSLISDQYVLTAAHCATQQSDTEVSRGTPQAVQLGSTYFDDPGALVAKIEAVYRHPKYRSRARYYDAALLKLKSKLSSFSDVTRPACLGAPPPAGQTILATGWGKTEIGGRNSFELRSASLSTWDLNSCQRVFAEDRTLPNGLTADAHLCAADNSATKKKSDTCQGDSGGPVQIQEGCVWRVVGITSIGHSCALPNTPAVYAVIPRATIGALLFPEPDVVDRGSFDNGGAIFFRD